MAYQPTPAQRAVMVRLERGLPPHDTIPEPLARRVISHDWGREGTTVLFHRFLLGELAPELWRVYADGRVSQH